MSTLVPIDEHERVIDYAYGMLDGDDKVQFEAHLVTCTRCQDELAGIGQVRAVVRSVLPTVEPTERLTGPLHVQLMHEASKRRPRGRVLSFTRRVLRHPGYAVAATLLVIGGAVGLQWSRGRLVMPAPERAATVAQPKPAVQPTTSAAAPEPIKEEKLAEAPVAAATPVSKHAAGNALQPTKLAAPSKKKAPSFDELASSPYSSVGGSDRLDAPADGKGGYDKVFKREVAREEEKSIADEVQAAPQQHATPKRDDSDDARQAQRAKSAVAQAPPAVAAPAPVATRRAKDVAPTEQSASQVGDRPKPDTQGPVDQSQRAASLAQSGRCDEAMAIYDSMDAKQMSADDKKLYKSCRTVVAQRKVQQQRAMKRAAPVPQNADPSQNVAPTAEPADRR